MRDNNFFKEFVNERRLELGLKLVVTGKFKIFKIGKTAAFFNNRGTDLEEQLIR